MIMGDVYMDLPVDRYRLQERKMAKLQQEIAAMEEKLHENVALRRQLENISDMEQERTQRVIDKMNSRNMVLKEEIDRMYPSKSPAASPSPNQLVADVITRRTREFSDQQHAKALQYKHLMAEKQRLQVAQERLRAKRLALHRLPTPEGKMTSRYWGHKYDIYTPLSYDSYFDVYSPIFESSYPTYSPHEYWRVYPEEEFWRKPGWRPRGRRGRMLYVPRPLYQSSMW